MAAAEKWVDVTEALRKGRGSLKTGEMLNVAHFALEQAMTAIEIGDVRMDMPVDKSHYLPELLKSGVLKTHLTWAETAQLLDCLTSKLVQWWEGKNLQQTVYTSLHMIAQNQLEAQPVLQAATALVSGIVSVCKHIIVSSCVINVRAI